MTTRETARMNRPFCETRSGASDPTLRPGVHVLPPDDLFRIVQEAVRSMPSWLLMTADRSTRRIEAVHFTPICRFPDDVEAWIVAGEQGAELYCRSTSRIGIWDFGRNARNLRRLLSRVAELAVDRPARIEESIPAWTAKPSIDVEDVEDVEDEDLDDEIEDDGEPIDTEFEGDDMDDEAEGGAKR
ncbi:MAG: DUF1499 domain-containing protein [Planctomycetes bacterium]|nr:DUF1499 domain-containing protein [Planctomycetota bacterium]